MWKIEIPNSPYEKVMQRLIIIEKLVELFMIQGEDADLMLDYIENGHSMRESYNLALDLIDNGECNGQEDQEDPSDYKETCFRRKRPLKSR